MDFELNLDPDGRACIRFKHYDKSSTLEEKVLKEFIDGCFENGCLITQINGYRSIEGISFNTYEIRIKQPNKNK